MTEKTTQANISTFNAGPLNTWYEKHSVQHRKMGEIKGKIFLKELLNFTGAEISLGELPPGAGVPFVHAHKQNEEIYLFLSGTGEMLLDEELYPVEEGSVVRVATPVNRSWKNTGTTPMSYVVIQVKTDSLEQWTATDGIITGENPWG